MFHSIGFAGIAKRRLFHLGTLLFVLLLAFVLFWNRDRFRFVGFDAGEFFRRQVEELFLHNETDAQLPNRQRVVCMIMTTVSNWETKGKAVRNTWAQRCHKTLFFYTQVADCSSYTICREPNAIGLAVPDGRNHLTAKTFAALIHSYKKYAAEADYFMKADDDTYVIMENLQRILLKFKSTRLLYLGRRFDNLLPRGYNSGGAGYILSKQAVKLMLLKGLSFPEDCLKDGYPEDYDIGKCLSRLGIYAQDDLDETGRLMFHSDNPLQVLQNDDPVQYYFIDISQLQHGNKAAINERGHMLSNWTVSFHYVSPAQMYMFDFLLYQLRRHNSYKTNVPTT